MTETPPPKNGVVDSGHPEVHLHMNAHTDGKSTTSFHIPPEVLAPSLGFPVKHAELAGHLVHTAEILHCDTPTPVGLTLTADGVPYGGTHAAHVVADQESTRGFHHVAFPGHPRTTHPVPIDIQHNGGENLASNVTQAIKRLERWEKHVGASEESLMAGTTKFQGDVKGEQRNRIAVPTDGPHPIARALQLNTNGHLSQYSPKHRTTVDIGGVAHTIMEEKHAQSICKTLASNLALQTPLARDGMKLVIQPITPGPPGDVRVTMRIKKLDSKGVLAADPSKDHRMHKAALTVAETHTVIAGEQNGPVLSEQQIRDQVLSAALRGSSISLPEPAPVREVPVLVHDAPSAHSDSEN